MIECRFLKDIDGRAVKISGEIEDLVDDYCSIIYSLFGYLSNNYEVELEKIEELLSGLASHVLKDALKDISDGKFKEELISVDDEDTVDNIIDSLVNNESNIPS